MTHLSSSGSHTSSVPNPRGLRGRRGGVRVRHDHLAEASDVGKSTRMRPVFGVREGGTRCPRDRTRRRGSASIRRRRCECSHEDASTPSSRETRRTGRVSDSRNSSARNIPRTSGEVLSGVLSEETRDELLIDLPVFDDEDERLGDVDLRRHVAAPVEEVTERLERRGHLVLKDGGVRRALRRGAVIIAAENIVAPLRYRGTRSSTTAMSTGQLSSEKRGTRPTRRPENLGKRRETREWRGGAGRPRCLARLRTG